MSTQTHCKQAALQSAEFSERIYEMNESLSNLEHANRISDDSTHFLRCYLRRLTWFRPHLFVLLRHPSLLIVCDLVVGHGLLRISLRNAFVLSG